MQTTTGSVPHTAVTRGGRGGALAPMPSVPPPECGRDRRRFRVVACARSGYGADSTGALADIRRGRSGRPVRRHGSPGDRGQTHAGIRHRSNPAVRDRHGVRRGRRRRDRQCGTPNPPCSLAGGARNGRQLERGLVYHRGRGEESHRGRMGERSAGPTGGTKPGFRWHTAPDTKKPLQEIRRNRRSCKGFRHCPARI